jgi:hypothetical protein
VVDFANKWDIGLIPTVVKRAIRSTVTQREGCATLELLLLSLKLKDNDLATEAFTANSDTWIEGPTDECDTPPYVDTFGLLEDVDLPLNYRSDDVPSFPGAELSFGGTCFDLGASFHQQFLQIPPTVVWIILKSQHLSAHDKKPVEQHLRRLMDNACESPVPSKSRTSCSDIRSSYSACCFGQEEESGCLIGLGMWIVREYKRAN